MNCKGDRNTCPLVLVCQSRGSCTLCSTTASRWLSAPTACSVPSCCSSSCCSLSSCPLPPVAGRWAECWASRCLYCILCSLSSASSWRIASLSVQFQSEMSGRGRGQTALLHLIYTQTGAILYLGCVTYCQSAELAHSRDIRNHITRLMEKSTMSFILPFSVWP